MKCIELTAYLQNNTLPHNDNTHFSVGSKSNLYWSTIQKKDTHRQVFSGDTQRQVSVLLTHTCCHVTWLRTFWPIMWLPTVTALLLLQRHSHVIWLVLRLWKMHGYRTIVAWCVKVWYTVADGWGVHAVLPLCHTITGLLDVGTMFTCCYRIPSKKEVHQTYYSVFGKNTF